jgi:putative membrane protein insertion efficiency factor
MKAFLKEIFIAPIRAYQFFLSPWLGQSCRFTPTCSNYAIEAIHTWGVLKGLSLGARRLGRCHPWCQGGHDPVPEKFSTPSPDKGESSRCHPD